MREPSDERDPQIWALLQQIVQQDLSGVCFIRDYVRFEFNPPPMIDALSKTIVDTPSGSAPFGDAAFANLAMGLIGCVVESVDFRPAQSFTIQFVGGGYIQISLVPSDAPGPEALLFHGRHNELVVF